MKNNNLSKKIIIIISLLFLLSLSLATVNATDININNSTNLNQTISNANDGDKINLDKGIYTNNVTNIKINKTITLVGKDPKTTIIDANKTGQIFTIEGTGRLILINITLTNGKAYYGGAILNSGKLELSNCIFTNNNATNDGGAIYNTAANIVINNSTFTNNTANYGGAITISYNAHYATIANCTFENNTSIRDGGAISNEADYFEVINSKFINNLAKSNGNGGGAIHNNGGNHFTLINSTFTNNTSNGYYGGGAIVNSYKNAIDLPDGDYFRVINCTFENNKVYNSPAYGVGGAITNQFGDYCYIINSTFINNTADLYSGAIYNSGGSNFSIMNCNFTDNKATYYYGGAITNADGKNFTIFNSNFTNNFAGAHGGAIFNDAVSTMNVTNSNFNNNKAGGNGGSIYNSGNMSVSRNSMSGNTANLGQMIYNSGNMGILNLSYLNNSTIIVDNDTYTILYVTLTDDMGNTVTGQNISFYVNGIFIGNQIATEGYANMTFLVNHGIGIVPVTGDYAGHKGFDIKINNGQLLIMYETDVIGTIDLDKDEYEINETAKGTINVNNNGSDTAYNVTVKVNLPKEFVLDKNSIIVSHGYYDSTTNIWYIGNLTVGEEAIMNFTGIFTEAGSYIVDILTSGANFNATTDSDTVLVKEPEEPVNPIDPIDPIDPVDPVEPIDPVDPTDPEDTDDTTNTTETSNNPTTKAALMKETGIPINMILLVLLSVLGVLIGRKQN